MGTSSWPWDDEKRQQALKLFQDGLSTAKIAEAIGFGKQGKNAVIGFLHRAGVDKRANPIKTTQQRQEARAAITPVILQRLRAGQSVNYIRETLRVDDVLIRRIRDANNIPVVTQSPTPQPVRHKMPIIRSATQNVLQFPVTQRAPAPAPAKPTGRITDCCWPIGEPRKKDFRYCDNRTVPGKVYCEEHYKIAYVRHRKEDVA